MGSFNSNAQIYNVTTENELAEVLSHYSSEFVFSIVDEALKKRFMNVPVVASPNVVAAWEQNFKAIINNYGQECKEQVLQVRNDTYREIIDTICKEFGMNFTVDDTVDLYSAAYCLYDLMVCNFTSNMISFFANFIYKERANLYEPLGLSELKKNKDTSTIYGKKIYKDIKLAVINANIDLVINHITSLDIPFYSIIGTIMGQNSEMKKYILTIVSAENDFFQKAYLSVLQSDIKPDIITGIRFKLQEIATAHDQINTVSEIDGAVINNDDKGE